MKKYRVNVNGNAYEVEIELIDEKEVANKEVAPKPKRAVPLLEGDRRGNKPPKP